MASFKQYQTLRTLWQRHLEYVMRSIQADQAIIKERKDKAIMLENFLQEYRQGGQIYNDALTLKTTMHFCSHIGDTIKDLHKQRQKAEVELQQKHHIYRMLKMKLNTLDELIEKRQQALSMAQFKQETKQIEELFRNFKMD